MGLNYFNRGYNNFTSVKIVGHETQNSLFSLQLNYFLPEKTVFLL